MLNGTRTTLLVGLLTLGISATAFSATAKYILSASSTSTPVSGSGGDYVLEVGPQGDFQAMYSIALEESSDRPCKVYTKSRHLNTASEQYQNDYIRSCYTPSGKKEVSFANRDTYIRGVQVCHNKSGVLKRVKGIRIYGSKLDKSTGRLTDVPGFKEFKRTNCSDWKPAKFCPADKVATSFNMQYHDNYAFDGISLDCRGIKPK